MGIRVRIIRASDFVFGAVLAALTVSVSAQEAQEQAPALEEVVVTGSYLYTGIDSPSPVTVFTGEDLMFQANSDMLSFFFENVTQNYTSDVAAQTGAGGNMGARSIRSTSINLRGLGPENSLVLLNGRRTINYPAPNFQGWLIPDINATVPRIAVQRTELLLDGGSALYGSDPVAGVTNFVTRNSFRGFDFSLDTRVNSVEPSAKNYTIGTLWGGGDDTTSVIAAIEFSQSDLILQSTIEGEDDPNPDVSPETGTGLNDLSALNFNGPGPGMGAAPPTWVDPDCGNLAFGPPLIAGYPSYEDSLSEIREADAMNPATSCSRPTGFNPGAFLQNNVKSTMIFMAGDHQVSDTLSINFEGNYTRQRFEDVQAWDGNNGWTGVNPANLGLPIPATHPGYLRATGLPQLGAQPFGTVPGMGIAPPSTVDVFQIDEIQPFNSTMDAFNRLDQFRIALGADGSLLPGSSNWQWHVDTTAAYATVENGLRDMIIDNYALAIEGYGGPLCTSDPANDPTGAAAGVGECYWYNPFMSAALPDAASTLPTGAISQTGLANDPTMIEWLIPNRVDTYYGEFWSADFLITGEFGELPGGPIGLAVGAAYRHEYNERDSDYLSTSNSLASVRDYNDWSGSQDVESLFFELALPVTDDISVQIAARQEEYVGSFTEVTPKIATIWTPTDRLTLRGSYGESFRAAGISQSQATIQLAGFAMGVINVGGVDYGMGIVRFPLFIEPDPDLLPQTSDNVSLGFDYLVNDRISVGATWTAIDFENRIGSPGGPNTLQSRTCVEFDGNGIPVTSNGMTNGFLQYVTVANGGCVVPIDPNAPIIGSNIDRVIGVVSNTEYLNAAFVDLHASFQFDTGIGPLNFSPYATITTKWEFPNTDGEVTGFDNMCPPPTYNCEGIGRSHTGMGTGFAGIGEMPRWQGVFPVRVTINGKHNIALTARYRDALNADVRDLTAADQLTFVHQDGQWTTQANYTYTFGNGGSLAFAVNNLTATDPPATEGARFSRLDRSYTFQFRQTLGN